MKTLFLLFVFISASSYSLGHSGGLDTNGGHIDRGTGLYHCHSDECSVTTGSLEDLKYIRDDWRHWVDTDGDCQDTRAEILTAHSQVDVEFRAIDNCVVESGEWLGPYSGEIFRSARDIDIDHVIPLNYASQNGGFSWSLQKKEAFANDPLNLLAVSSTENRKKGAKGPAKYLPTGIYECPYVKRWLAIAAKYELTLAFDDLEKITEILKGCE
jgi:hypothetical protein